MTILLGGRPFRPSCHCVLTLTQLSNTVRINKSDFRLLGPLKKKAFHLPLRIKVEAGLGQWCYPTRICLANQAGLSF